MRAWQDVENEVSHPLDRFVLLEYEEAMAQSISASVPAGTWTPSAAYVVLVAKATGSYRELSFPSLIDTIVGRREVESWGGRVQVVPLTPGQSTTRIIEALRARS